MAQKFQNQFNIQFPLYTDPSKATYRALSFPRGIGIGISTFTAGFGAASKGFTQGATAGDPLQQGGEVLFDGKGVVLFKNIAKKAGQHIDGTVLLERIKGSMTERE